MEYRILIVEQNAHWRRLYCEALIAEPPAVNTAYKITALSSAAAAQLQMARQRFNLVVVAADEVSGGTRLIAVLRELYRDDVRLLLIYDHTTEHQQLQHARTLDVRLLDRADGGEALAIAVAELLGLRPIAPAVSSVATHERPPATLADVQMLLDMVRREARAQFAIYATNVGHIIARQGDDSAIDVPALASLVAGSFVNSAELGRILHDPDTVHLSVHEGHYYDVYSANVGNDRMVILLFDKGIVAPKLGFVFLMMKRAAQQLRRMRLLVDTNEALIDQQLSASLNDEFDRIFGSELVEEHQNPNQ